MKFKCVEVRDEGTCIAVLAIRMQAADAVEKAFLWRCDYPEDGQGVVLMKLSNQHASSDAYAWGNRTMTAAHRYIQERFDGLADGAVVDARVALGEAEHAVPAEIYTGTPA